MLNFDIDRQAGSPAQCYGGQALAYATGMVACRTLSHKVSVVRIE